MFPITNLGKILAVFQGIVGTIINSMITASIMDMLDFNNKEMKSFDVSSRVIQRNKLKDLVFQYTMQNCLVKVSKKRYYEAKESKEGEEVSKAFSAYYFNLKTKMATKKKLKMMNQFCCKQ